MPRTPSESPGNGEEGESPPSTMERFARLAKGLLGVPPAELKDEERKFKEREKTARVAPRGPSDLA